MDFSAVAHDILAGIQANAFGQQVLEFVKAHGEWAPVIVFLLAFGESLAVIGFFVPATFALVGIGALIGTTDIEFWPVWLGAAAGAGLGDWVSYWVGYKLENTAKHVWPLSRYPDLYDRGERFFRRWGVWSVFLGRFFGPVRAIVPLVAGVFEMPRVLFQAANWASAMVWAFVLLAPGFAALKILQY
ncbi:MAG: DedA family protein [Bradyrhizobiaceae bacterium]|nr:DedA family protein [Bradyrhizobiaceae bacterium]